MDGIQEIIDKAKNSVASSFGMTWDRILMDRSIIEGALDMVIKIILKSIYDSSK